ncbi:EamA family transporter [Asticcacaulis sp. 201]|uniref:EamA family transporter n=1 Tax=Asticcacaulis sp. 201 TaxID=3028787 RepID=UPI002916358B|nr:EamA family transporter [Asticcacaulis sp. 201]MDV6331362.1 EamA family transporter [Asticcacaulis sp. 201]
MNSRYIKGCGLALMSAVLWGVSGVCGQFLFAQRGVNTEWLVTTRMLAAAILMLGFVAVRAPGELFVLWKDRTDALRMLVFGVFGMLAVQYTYFAAINASNAATATILQYTGPALIVGWFAFKERRLPRLAEWLGVAMAVAGTVFLVTHGRFGSLSISQMALVWGLGSAVALAFYSIQPLSLMHRYAPPVVIGWGMLIGGVLLSLVRPPWAIAGTWDAATIGAYAFVIVFGTLVPFYAYLTAVKIIGPQTGSLLACAEPLSAAIISVLWLGTRFGPFDWLGTALILGTVVMLTLGKPAETSPKIE